MVITALQREIAKYSGNNWAGLIARQLPSLLYNLCPLNHCDWMLTPQIVSDHPSLESAIGYWVSKLLLLLIC